MNDTGAPRHSDAAGEPHAPQVDQSVEDSPAEQSVEGSLTGQPVEGAQAGHREEHPAGHPESFRHVGPLEHAPGIDGSAAPPPAGESTPGAPLPPNASPPGAPPHRSSGAGLAGGIIVAIAVLFVLGLLPLLLGALAFFLFRRSSDAALGGMLDHAGHELTLL